MNHRCIIFSLPGQNDFSFVRHNELDDLVVQMCSFDANRKIDFRDNTPLQLSESELFSADLFSDISTHSQYDSYTSPPRYFQEVEELQKKMFKKSVDKVVFARIIQEKASVNILKTLFQLKKQNPNALCYVAMIDKEEVWMGATPEILLKETKATYETMSLAGTLPNDQEWSQKEIEEQQFVTHYIEKVIQSENSAYEVSPMGNLVQGDFKHLVQYFRIQKEGVNFYELLERLHPTPAVCGIPKKEAISLIEEFELHPREFYTGYLSIFQHDRRQAYVNLRCAKVFKEEINLFVGGGITKDSIPENEWQETELKAQVLLKNMILD